jgi:hypothetical protein
MRVPNGIGEPASCAKPLAGRREAQVERARILGV